jgi:hypothetical protein
MFKFITEPEEKKELTFADVKLNQFFVDGHGYLCQKTTQSRYNYIATPDGEPYSHYASSILSSMRILRICPIVKKIEF